jgi:N utilization substance protein A
MVTGIVQRFERKDVIVNIGRAEAVMTANEQPAGAHFRFNDRIKVMIVRVEETTRGPNIIVSRKTPQLVIELFKQEVPEISDGTVQIVGIAREAGVRTKIAVKSVNSDVDPVGACVGMKGSRVQMVVRELENEKIDIVPYSSEIHTFIRNALNPAKIVNIELDNETKRAEVTVAQGNLAIAIGRKGQNTKLAARLTGYRLDIRSENEDELAYEEIQRRYLEDFLSQIEGLPEFYKESIMRSSFNSVDKIAKTEYAKLMPFAGDNEELCYNLINGAKEYLEALREMETIRKDIDAEDAEDAEGDGDDAAVDDVADGDEVEGGDETAADDDDGTDDAETAKKPGAVASPGPKDPEESSGEPEEASTPSE